LLTVSYPTHREWLEIVSALLLAFPKMKSGDMAADDVQVYCCLLDSPYIITVSCLSC